MSKSWGHRLRRLTYTPRPLTFKTPWENAQIDRGHKWTPHCGRSRMSYVCAEAPEYQASYRFTTGKAGRTGERGIPVCRRHALEFARKYGLNEAELGLVCPDCGAALDAKAACSIRCS